MAKTKTYTIVYRRKREGKTDYKKRLNYLKSGKIRIVIRPSTNNMTIQAVKFEMDGDKVLLTVQSTDLRKMGWNYATGNIPASYLTGLLFGVKAKEIVKEGVIDLGLRPVIKGTRIPATIKGLVDAGLQFNYDEKIFPSEESISGKVIAEFAEQLSKEDKEKYEKQFSKYLKNNQKPEKIAEAFEATKNKILGSK